MTVTQWYVVAGRSIDGTVYRHCGGWVDYKPAAERMTLEMANATIEMQRQRNKSEDADGIVGRLQAVPVAARRSRRRGKHRAWVYAANCEFAQYTGRRYDPRKVKRAERRMGMDDPLMAAYYSGEAEAMQRNPRGNPYPPGKRHDTFERGAALADPMGEHHGRNA